jgi:hypothetical protein
MTAKLLLDPFLVSRLMNPVSSQVAFYRANVTKRVCPPAQLLQNAPHDHGILQLPCTRADAALHWSPLDIAIPIASESSHICEHLGVFPAGAWQHSL